ncbi:MAG: hypothetical protein K2W82_14160 [Candidatus Obscuribacterales bacterium]|nr:hypothetical protein [Candidatus Obscuribacterales bacterium]
MILNILLPFAVLAVLFFTMCLYHGLTTIFTLAFKGAQISDEDIRSILAYKIRMQRNVVLWAFFHTAALGLSWWQGIYPLTLALCLLPVAIGLLVYGHWHTYCRR